MAHLFLANEGNQKDLAQRALYPKDNTAAEIARHAYSQVNTGGLVQLSAGLAAGLSGKPERMTEFTDLLSRDAAIAASVNYDTKSPDDAQRLRLTRYLLHQLIPDATLHQNPLVIQEAEAALEQGIKPFSVQEAHAVIKQFVSSLLEQYKSGATYL